MGNGYNHHFEYQRNLNNIQKSTFLPMLCSRTSIKDVALPRLDDRPASFSQEDPLSPKIGCMGQVKRNNKITGFPTATTSHNNNNNNNKKQLALTTKTSSNNFNVGDVKYFKLKRFFSVRNIATNSNNNNNTSCTASSCRRRETNTHGGSIRPRAAAAGNENKEREARIINIAQMDPPLPVVKRVPKPAADQAGDENNNSLWRRRSNGGALKSLDLQHIQIPRHQVEIRTV